MKAVTLKQVSDDLGGVEVLDVPTPEPPPGMVRVRMVKAAVHPSDLNYIRGDYREAIERLIWNYGEAQPTFDPGRTKPHPELPCIPGGEGVGIVDACGEGVDDRQWLNKRVGLFAGPPSGTWQEYVLAAPPQLSPVPESLPDEQAALMMLNPLTALVMVRQVLKIDPGRWVLLSAGASAVSKMIAALGRHDGFRTISVVRGNHSADESLGDAVVNTSSQDLRQEVKRITDGRGVDCAIDCVGGELAAQMLGCLTGGGSMLLYGTLSGPSMTLFSRDLMMPNASISGFYLPGWLAAQPPETLGAVMAELASLSATGLFFSDIAAQYPLAAAVDAVRSSLESGRSGKILLSF